MLATVCASVEPWDIFPETIVPAGSLATVVENSLNEMQPCLIVLPDDDAQRVRLKEWSGNVWLWGPDDDALDVDGHPVADSKWLNPSPVERA